MHLAILFTVSTLLLGVSQAHPTKDKIYGSDQPHKTGAQNSVRNIAAALENSGANVRGRAVGGFYEGKTLQELSNVKVQSIPKPWEQSGNPPVQLNNVQPNKGRPASPVQRSNTQPDEGYLTPSVQADVIKRPESGAEKSVRDIAAELDRSRANLMGRAVGGFYEGKSLQELSNVKVQSSPKPWEQSGNPQDQVNNVQPNKGGPTSPVQRSNTQPDEGYLTPSVQADVIKRPESGAEKSVRDIAAELDRSRANLMGRAVGGFYEGKTLQELSNDQTNPKRWEQSGNPPVQLNDVQPNNGRPTSPVQRTNIQPYENHPIPSVQSQVEIQTDPTPDQSQGLSESFQCPPGQHKSQVQPGAGGGQELVQAELSDQSQPMDYYNALESKDRNGERRKNRPWWSVIFCIPD